ncbi:MAG: TatD family hydrolase [Planctomycetota bacterium]
MIDTHCHLTFPDLAHDVEGIIEHAKSLGVNGMITVSTTTANCVDCLELAERFDNVWCSSGVHPLYSDPARGDRDAEAGEHDWARMRKVAEHERCVAWGELGLDMHYDEPPLDLQKRVLAEQLALIEQCDADGLVKPIIVHCRKAVGELIPILRSSTVDPSRFVFHCFTEGPDDARAVLDFGAMISFTGIVTYNNAQEVAESARLTPLDRMMAETDAPFLSPRRVRKQRPCLPGFSRYTAEFLAELKEKDWAAFESIIDDNTERFFGIRVPSSVETGA